MTWQTMYPANPGSPYTTLASGIDEDDTSISLTADPGFAAATNLACIWDDAGNFEVVKYTDLTGTTLTAERGFEGTAQAWSAGAYIANLIPAYAINSLQNNVNELNTGKVPTTRTVNSKSLSADVTLDASDVGAVPTSRTVNSKALSTDISLTPADVGAQPADATLTALAGVTTGANKLPYFSGEDTAAVADLTAFGRSLIGETTAAAVRDLIGATSSTIATQLIYVDKAASGAGTGVDWTNAFTTGQAAINSLPAIINHNVTIIIRKGVTPYAENLTFKRVIGAGSVTICGEFFWSGTNASSKSGKIDINSADAHYADRAQIEAGDEVLVVRFTGTVGGSKPTASYRDTVASVSGTEVTLTTNTGVAFDGSCSYHISKTRLNGVITTQSNLTISGIIDNYTGSGWAIIIDGCKFVTNSCIFSGASSNIMLMAQNNTSVTLNSSDLVSTFAGGIAVYASGGGTNIVFPGSRISAASDGAGLTLSGGATGGAQYSHIAAGGTGIGCNFGSKCANVGTCLNDATTPLSPATSADWNYIA